MFIILIVVKVLVAQSCLTLCDPMDCSLPGSSVHGISQARILKWVAISFSRDKTFLSDQCREIKENSIMRKTKDLKKIRATNGTFHVKMGTIKDRNGMIAENIKKRWQEYTEELYKKDLNR